MLKARLRADEGIFSDGQAVWSCPPDAGDKPLETIVARRRGPTSPEPRGERGAAVNTIAQGMPVAGSSGRRNTLFFHS